MQLTERTGSVIAIKAVCEEDDLMIITKSGISIRVPVSSVRIMGRATQGVKVIRLGEDEEIADVAVVETENGNQEEEE